MLKFRFMEGAAMTMQEAAVLEAVLTDREAPHDEVARLLATLAGVSRICELNLRVLDSGDSDHAKLSQLHVANAELCDLLQEVLA
jgi:hypothetical protein